MHPPAHRKPFRLRSRIAPLAASALALTLGGLALSGAFGSSVPASAAVNAPAAYTSTTDLAAGQAALSALRGTIAQAAADRAAKTAAPAAGIITVAAGQTLSSIAASTCGNPADWTGIYAASRKAHQTARNAASLAAGQHLTIQCYQAAGMAGRAYVPPPVMVQTAAYRAPARAAYQPRVQHKASHRAAAAATYNGGSGMQGCIISRESGGNSQVMNSSSHYGLYQFSSETWAAHGGNPADFGNASVAEQNTVYQNTVAADGYSDWAPYDGCLWFQSYRNAQYS